MRAISNSHNPSLFFLTTLTLAALTIYGGGSVGNNGAQLNIGLSSGESNYNKIFYTNSQINAENGTLTLATSNDANISGANLLAKNTTLNIGNNLNVSSKQTEEDFSSSGFGFNFGVGVGAGGNGGNVGGGFNMSNADMHRLWVDDITTIKGTDGMAVNVGKDLNLTGAAILSDNLALAVTGNTNKKELQDSYYSESMSLGASASIAVGGNQATVPGTGGKPNQSPGGSTTISGSYAQNESSRTTFATIGGLDSTLTSATKDVTGGDFEGSLTIDHRLFSEAGRRDIGRQLNYSRLLVQAPVEDGIKLMKSDQEDKVSKFGSILATDTVATTRLFLNKDITAQQLTGDKNNLVAYDGNSLSDGADAKNATAFYDHKENTVALNASQTDGMSNQQLASVIGHEAIGHGIGGKSEYVADNTQSHVNKIWNTFQSDNTSFQLNLPQITQQSNNYANGVSFDGSVSPMPILIPVLVTAYYAYKGDGNALKGMSNDNNAIINSAAGKAVGKVVDKVVTGADVVVNKLGAEEGSTPVRDALTTAGKAYDKYVPEDSKEVLGAFGLTTTVLGVGSVGRSLLKGTELEIGGAAIKEVAVSNPVPDRISRIAPSSVSNSSTLGVRGAPDVFVTGASDVAGINNSIELATKLRLLDPNGNLVKGPFTIYEFDTPSSGIASPVFRDNPGFVSTGTGRTGGDLREFVIPNLEKKNLNNLIERSVP